MKGQWIGHYIGDTSGTIILNVDEMPTCFQGVAYLIEQDPNLPMTAALFKTRDKSRSLQFRTSLLLPINPHSALPDLWEKVKSHYPNDVTFSNFANVNLSWDQAHLSLSWTSDIGVSGSCELTRSKAGQPSELIPLTKDWESFKTHMMSQEKRRYLFRGQNRPWRLRTSFHRTGRADLNRFSNEDIQTLHKQLSARTKHVFNLDIPNENRAFFNLVQHHGYPTPLLDWSYSPYGAAFFAYRGISNEVAQKSRPEEKVLGSSRSCVGDFRSF